jgi:sarcosine oxidase subunit beta
MGLSIAYNLAKRGAEVVVLESRYPGSGLSVRAIGALHTQWDNEHDIKLAKLNRDILERLSGVLNFNIPFRQDGYLALATDGEQLAYLRKFAKLQKSMGIDTTFLLPDEIARRYPIIETSSIVGGTLSKGDGSVHPFSLVFGYWNGLMEHGGKLVRPTLVKGLHPRSREIYAVETDQGIYEVDEVIISAGVGTRGILQSVGLDVPTVIVRHEMLATEPLRFFLKPMIELYPNRLYVNQSLRGEILCHIPRPDPEPKDTKSTLEFLQDAATELTQILPSLRTAKVLRSWAGLVETTPDSEPICGNIGYDNLWIALGDSGKGLMLAPLIGELLSEAITTGEPNADLLSYSPPIIVTEGRTE